MFKERTTVGSLCYLHYEVFDASLLHSKGIDTPSLILGAGSAG